MRTANADRIIRTFSNTIENLKIDLKNDSSWPIIATELLKNTSEELQLEFWEKLETFFLEKEIKVGLCHKGQIYWKLSLLYLQKGNITKCIDLLEKSVNEDNRIHPNGFSASIGMLSVLKPLLNRYKDGKSWTFDQEINDYYLSLTNIEKRDFAKEFFDVHDMTATGSIWVIKDDFFGFIGDNKMRQVIFDTYVEVREIVMGTNLTSYYSCLFSIGSIVEGMLDDLFERDDQTVWNAFHNDAKIQAEVKKDKRIASSTYNAGMTLGEKIRALLLMAKYNKLPMPKHAILQMLIIGEYRDLIHPRRRLDSPYKPNRYVASFLFTLISRFAGHWWPENIHKLLNN